MDTMAEVPFGETRTDGKLAAELMAVAGACGRNPISMVVPCHRDIARNRSLCSSSADSGLAMKRRLLDHEQEGIP